MPHQGESGERRPHEPESWESVIWGRKQEASRENLRGKGMELVVGEGSRKGSQPPGGRFRPTVTRLCPMGQIWSPICLYKLNSVRTQVHPLVYMLFTRSELSSCDRDYMSFKDYCINHVALNRKNLQALE